jgi:general secretion pathway protein A
MLTGEFGSGKTTLCRSLLEQLGPRVVTSFVGEALSSVEELLNAALVDFGAATDERGAGGRLPPATAGELGEAVGHLAASHAAAGRSALMVVDEAQNIPAALLHAAAALATADDRGVGILLVGPPALASRLARPDLQQLGGRVTVRCRVGPLDAAETASYLRHRLAAAGSNGRCPFDEPAIAALHAATRGMPRVINLVCDRALAIGHASATTSIDDSLIARAASELDLVPQQPTESGPIRTALIVMLIVVFTLAGAGAATWVFRADVSRLLQQRGWSVPVMR